MDNNVPVKKTNTLPYIIGGVVLAATAAAGVVYNKISGGKIANAISSIWNNILLFLQKIGTALKTFGQAVYSFAGTAISGLKNGGAAVINFVKAAISRIGVFFSSTKQGVGSLWIGTKNVFFSIGGFISRAVSAIARFAQKAWTTSLPYIKAGLAGLKDFASRAWALIKFGAQQAWGKLSPLLARLWQATKTFFSWLGAQIKAGVERAIPVIKDLAARAWVVLKELAKKFVALMRTPAGLCGAGIVTGVGLIAYGFKKSNEQQPNTTKRIACVVAGTALVAVSAVALGMKIQAGLAFVPVI